MRRLMLDLVVATTIAGLAFAALQPRPLAPASPLRSNPPLSPRRPFLPWKDAVFGAKVAGEIAPDGVTKLSCNLPSNLQMHNKSGTDGRGLCVFTSIAHSARWQNENVFKDFRDWMTKYPGGGYPEKVDRMIAKLCKDKGVEVPDYIQVEGGDLEILKLASKTGRMPSVTYSHSPTGRYKGKRINHMVSLPHADDQWFCVLDNNYPSENGNLDIYEWMSPDEFKKTYAPGWAVILLASPPPPAPHN